MQVIEAIHIKILKQSKNLIFPQNFDEIHPENLVCQFPVNCYGIQLSMGEYSSDKRIMWNGNR